MDKRLLLQNFSVAFIAQGVSMTLGVIQTLLVPKVLGVEQFSWWQLYLFYVSYVGFFHLGLSSGVYLTMGGISREEMDKDAVKTIFIFGVLFQSAMAAAIIVFSRTIHMEEERQFVILQTGIYLVFQNAATFMMNVLQCMNETKKSSYSTIVERTVFFLPLLLFVITDVKSYHPYVYAYTFSTIAQLAYCFWNLRDFICAKWLGSRRAVILGVESMRIGISLMLANVASMLILGIARSFIDYEWGIETFGKLSLSLSMASFFLAFVNQAGMVLFPALRQTKEDQVKGFYSSARDALSLTFPIVYVLYAPMVWLLGKWLPDYTESFKFLALLLPICVFDSKMSIIGRTYLNVLRKERVLLLVNVFAAMVSLLASLIGVRLLHSPTAVIGGATLAIVLRSVVTEEYVARLLGLQRSSLSCVELGLTCLFVLLSETVSLALSFLIFTSAYAIFLLGNRKHVETTLRRLKG